jgi:serine/threonine-protein kinase
MLVGQHIGPFEIEQELGSGAMGTVYRAKFHKDETKVIPVALKVVALGLLGNEGAMARFTRESAILKQLRHPHIVKLIATGRHRQTPFIAMEYIDGEPLDRALARRGRLSWEEVVSHGKQLCLALQHAHEHGIIHRDLKPSNLMITKDGTLKLTDFGIAKDTDVTALTGANSTIGTAAYMSPEQCKGERSLTPKSDLYSLGVVFFELVTGRKPFNADNTVEMFLKHVNEKPPRPGKIVPDLPAKFEAMILQLMEKEKDARPTDAAWVVRMLGEIEEDAFARKSAGLDAATARRGDRPRGADRPPIEDSDREAAQALRGVKKRKKKREVVPLLQQKWLKATAIVVALLGIAVGVYLAVRAPSAEKLFAAVETVEKRLEANDEAVPPEAKIEPAERYLKAYGEADPDRTERAARLFRTGKVQERESQLTNRFRKNMQAESEDDTEAYNATFQAMAAEKAGNLKDAADWWAKVKARFPKEAELRYTFDAAELAKARWGWVAEKRLADIQEASRRTGELTTEIKTNRNYEVAMPYDSSNPKSLAVRGFRADEFQDKDRAGRTWDALIAMTEKKPEQHVWYLIACQQRPTIPPTPAEGAEGRRVSLIQEKLDEAKSIFDRVKDNPEKRVERARVRELCREIVELYDDEPAANVIPLVDKAKQIMKDVPKSG